MEKMRKRYRSLLVFLLIMAITALFGYSIYYVNHYIPNNLYLHTGEVNQVNLHMPIDTSITCSDKEALLCSQEGRQTSMELAPNEAFLLQSGESKRTSLDLSAFGKIKLKSIQLEFQNDEYLLPLGMPCGIYLKTDGILVVDIETLNDIYGNVASPCNGILQPEDYIMEVNQQPVESKEELISFLQQNKAEKVTLRVRRGGEYFDVAVSPMETAQDEYRIGVWVKDDLQGIGTLTYVRADGSFGALGHGINETGTANAVQIKEGALFESKIRNVIKGSVGSPGSFSGMICYSANSYLGTVAKNTNLGIFGTLLQFPNYTLQMKPTMIAYQQEVKKGAATMLCSVGGQPEEFQVEILEVRANSDEHNKNLIFQVTDEQLLAQTGGIVQGMSGAPLLQNGKIIGAVTHVFVNDPTKGYGILIENMLEN